jgi:predicted DNA binding CopG/RHH family protein
MKKAVQYFSDEYLEYCKSMTSEQIIEFLENFRELHMSQSVGRKKTKLISIKVPEDLLQIFQQQAKRQGVPYQTQIKKLMLEWTVKDQKD